MRHVVAMGDVVSATDWESMDEMRGPCLLQTLSHYGMFSDVLHVRHVEYLAWVLVKCLDLIVVKRLVKIVVVKLMFHTFTPIVQEDKKTDLIFERDAKAVND